MNYELFKKLNDAGFPQNLSYKEGFGDDLRFPRLDQLIEACGGDFAFLSAIHKVGNNVEIESWTASAFFDLEGKGSTPEEAAANLWLSLNTHE